MLHADGLGHSPLSLRGVALGSCGQCGACWLRGLLAKTPEQEHHRVAAVLVTRAFSRLEMCGCDIKKPFEMSGAEAGDRRAVCTETLGSHSEGRGWPGNPPGSSSFIHSFIQQVFIEGL